MGRPEVHFRDLSQGAGTFRFDQFSGGLFYVCRNAAA